MNEKKQSARPAEGAGVGHNSSTNTRVETVGLDQVRVWPPAQDQADDVTDEAIDEEVTILADAGQRRPLPARYGANGKIEVVAGAHVLRAIAHYNDISPDHARGVEVRLFKQLSDEVAFRTLAQEIEPVEATSSLARGRIYMRAIVLFGSETAVANGCRVSKSAVSKNLDVVRACEFLGDKVLVSRDISQRDATWLMPIVGRAADGSDAPDVDQRATVLKTLDAMELAPAKRVFAALRAALKVKKPRRGEQVLRHGDREIARVRDKKGQIVRIDLADVGDIELDTIMGVLREALASARRKLI